MPRRIARAALALTSSVVCACGLSAPPKCPSQGGSAWSEVTTKHFVLLTDLDDDRARDAAKGFETSFEELRAVAFPRPERGPRFTIVLFQDERERHAFRSVVTGAEYSDRLRLDLERSPTIIMNAARYAMLESDAKEAFLHELTHSFIAHTYGGVPMWMNEGLAQYLSTVHIDDGKATLGEPPFGYRLTPGVTPSVGELLAANRETFYGGQKTTLDAHDARYRYYTGSWAFVHFLENGPDAMRARFQVFIQRLDGGDLTRDAWSRAFGDVPALDLEQQFLGYMTADRWNLFERPVQPAAPSAVERTRALSDEEVHLLWARLSSGAIAPTDPSSMESQLAEAARVAPASAEVSYRRGCLALARAQRREAQAQFGAALAREPDDPRYLFGALVALHTAQPDATGSQEVERRDMAERLFLKARSADQLTLVAELDSERGNDARAMRCANGALAADPGYYRALAGRALVHFRARRCAEAVADQERAVALAPEQLNDPALMRTLRAYQKALEGPTDNRP